MSGTHTIPFSYSQFTVVKPRRKRRNNSVKQPAPPSDLLNRIRGDLEINDWVQQCKKIIENACTSLSFENPGVLCLGLGSPTSSHISRVQLAFLIEICERLSINPARISVYDPVFTAEDTSLFDDLKINVLTENRNGEHCLNNATICFMPHCDMELYENLIRSNWTPKQILKLLLVANSLSDYIDSNPSHKLEDRVPFLLRLAPNLQSQLLPECAVCPTAFNNTSVQYVLSQESEIVFAGLLKPPESSEDS